MRRQEQAAVAGGVVAHHAVGADVAAVGNHVVEELRAVDRIGLRVGVVQREHLAVEVRVADHLRVVCRLVACRRASVREARERAGGGAARAEDGRRADAAAAEFVEIVVGDGVAVAEHPHAPHVVVERVGEHHIAIGVVGTAGEEVVAGDDVVIALADADLAVVVEDRVVPHNVAARLDRDHLRLTRGVARAAIDRLDRVVEGVRFDRDIEVHVDEVAAAAANRLPAVGQVGGQAAVGGHGQPGVGALRDLPLAEVIVVEVMPPPGRVERVVLVDDDRGLADRSPPRGIGHVDVVGVEVAAGHLAVLHRVVVAVHRDPGAVVVVVGVVGAVPAAVIELDVRNGHVP